MPWAPIIPSLGSAWRPLTGWILYSGIWNDFGVWLDDGYWRDSEQLWVTIVPVSSVSWTDISA